jgi:para-nitrobenzyl esterase
MRTAWIALALALAASPAAAQIKQAKVTGGTVAGAQVDGLSEFKGIPFAAPPVGANRWRAPQPVVPWKGVKQTVAFGPACMQGEQLARQMGSTAPLSEDCLYIDVWTPAKKAGERLPVIAWIYGGGFNSGMSSVPLYDGANFARSGVVFVSINYRVGPFGFLATRELSRESGHGSGNWGLLDMIKGLHWVHDNVAQFGGNPANVTIMGHSAGGQAVSDLIASPLAKGLFHKAIAESGSSFAPLQASADVAGGVVPTQAFAEANDTAWLAKLGAHNLAEARALTAAALDAGQRQPGAPRFAPVADGYVIPGDEYALWQARRYADVPVLIGHTSNEWAAGTAVVTPAAFEKQVRDGYGASAESILALYPHATDAEATKAAARLRTDNFQWNGYTWADLQAKYGRAPAYAYWFHRPTAQAPDGSPHGSEVAFVFANEDKRRTAWTAEDRSLSQTLHAYWVNFAKTGNPNGPGLPAWPRYAAGRPTVMALGAQTQPIALPNASRLATLDRYYAWRRSLPAASATGGAQP